MPGFLKRPVVWLCVLAVGVPAVVALRTWRSQQTYAGRTFRAGIRDDLWSSSTSREGRIDALALEVVSAAARRGGIQLKWTVCPEGPDAALRAGKVDIWPMVTILPERRKYLYMTEPWLASRRCLVTKGPPRTNWKGVPVSYGLGPFSSWTPALEGALPVYKPGDVAAIEALCAGEAGAAYIWSQVLGSFALRLPKGCENSDVRITPLGKAQQLGVGSTFAAAGLAGELRRQIGRMAASGALEDLFNRYSLYSVGETAGMYELADAERRSRLLTYSSAGLLLALAVLLWQVRGVREARRTAERANRSKSEFLANMSHEIRTPLNGIVGMTELLANSPLNHDQREITRVILGSSETLVSIVNDILDFSKIEAGGLRIEEIPTVLRSTIEITMKLFASRVADKGLALEYEIAPDVPETIVGDPLRIRQVLLNLISNAIKFTDQGKVRLEVGVTGEAELGRAILFRVIDTGIGIEPAVSRKLFRAFTQADSATTRKYGGTGLGLAISLRLVSLMGGAIGLESEPGRGSVFWFLIPAKAVDPVEAAAVVPAGPVLAPPLPGAGVILPISPVPQSAHRVLVVEDNPVNQLVAVRLLRSLGYEAEVAPGGEAALEALAGADYDLVFMDCQMPGMDGYETTAEIRRREGSRRRTPIVAMTANAVDGDEARCLASGMDGYLAKPIRVATLRRMLDHWLSLKSSGSVA